MSRELVYTFKGHELIAQCLGRRQYHREKAASYRQKAEVIGGLTMPSPVFQNSSDTIQNLTDEAESHDRKAEQFQLKADHLQAERVYELAHHDLAELEFIDRY
jgi:hypothetical protein